MHRDESLARSNEIDDICDQFERQWLAGGTPQIEDVLAEHTSFDRSRLLRELLLIELEVRRTHGESPSAAEYANRFPQQTAVIDDALQTISKRGTNPEQADTVTASFNSADETYVPTDPAEAETMAPVWGTAPQQRPSNERSGKQFGDYELLHEIARGGMGVVYKAKQTRLNRIVALKMIKAGELAGELEVQRFQAEAEAAAQLDHPGIVPIYEVGEQSGQHFFSMGFIDGAGLDSKLKDGPLPAREAAELAVEIARAVQFAHDKGIVHRDLKPANVLIDADGTPKISDFGLAKNIAGDSGMTETGQVMGTPSYMPPEQASGKIEEIGPLSDVYSLGAMLYAMLTGRPPFQAANVMDTLVQVLEQQPVSPRTINPAVDKDLETICLKCLEKDAAKRYADARGLADDVECYLAGKPILARPIGRVDKCWRWCKRNPLGATVAGLLLFLAVAGPAVAAIQIEMNRQLDKALSGEKEATAIADMKVIELAASLKRETAEKKRANQNLIRADEVVDRFLMEVGKEGGPLGRHPGTQSIRKQLLQMGREYYETLIKENPNATLTPRLATANFRLGVILSMLSGTAADALAAYDRSQKILHELVTRHPEKPVLQNSLAAIHSNVGVILDNAGNLKLAIENQRKAMAIRQILAQRFPNDRRYRFELGSSHVNLGVSFQKTSDFNAALRSYREALEVFQGLLDEFPANAEYQSAVADCHTNLGIMHKSLDEPEKALEAHHVALKIRKRLSQQYENVTKYDDDLSATHFNIGKVLALQGNSATALDSFRRAIAISERLSKENPLVAEFSDDLGDSCFASGRVLIKLGKTQDALEMFRRTLLVRKKMSKDNPEPRYLNRLASTHGEIGLFQMEMAMSTEALESFVQARKGFELLVKLHPSIVSYRSELGGALNNIGVLYRKTNRPIESMTAHQRAIGIFENLVTKYPDNTIYRDRLAVSIMGVANAQRSRGMVKESIPNFNGAIKILVELRRLDPQNKTIVTNLRNAHANLAFAFSGLLRHQDAAREFGYALGLAQGRLRHMFERQKCMSLARAGKHQQTAAMASLLLKTPRSAHTVYWLAGCLALSAESARDDSELAPAKRLEYEKRYTLKAIALLKALARSGVFKSNPAVRGLLETDPNLNALRHQDDFRTFAKSVGVVLPAWARKPATKSHRE